ncbi:hypothetical protein PC119_g11835, partial [Phytophthora cactorum]
DDGVVDVKYVSTTENVADILAKAFRPSAFRVSPPKAQHGERAECTGEHAGGAGEGRLVKTAIDINAKMLVVLTETGNTARLVAKYRPEMPVLVLTALEQTAR